MALEDDLNAMPAHDAAADKQVELCRQRVREFIEAMRRNNISPEPLYEVTSSRQIQKASRKGILKSERPGIVEDSLSVVAEGWIYTFHRPDGPAPGEGRAIGTDGTVTHFIEHWPNRGSGGISGWGTTVLTEYKGLRTVSPSFFEATTARSSVVPIATGDSHPFTKQFATDHGYRQLVELAAFYTGRASNPPIIYDTSQ